MVDHNFFSIYIHVPFCTRKCDYCHFYVIPNRVEHKNLYLKSIKEEILRSKNEFFEKKLVSIYFGGGTPSLLSPAEIGQILQVFSEFIEEGCEITLEANPESVSLEQMVTLKKLGINRVSLGVQSFENNELIQLSRKHSNTRAKEAVFAVYNSGISNISIDLMYDLPHQTMNSWDNTLTQALALPITHISLYNLTLEPHTLFYKKRESLQKLQPSSEESLALLNHALNKFTDKGFSRYEVSAFCKNNKVSVHNLGYWQGRPFLGFGPSAFSYWKNKRFRREANLHRWSKKIFENKESTDFIEELAPSARLLELLAIGLRVTEGVNLTDFAPLCPQTQNTLSNLITEGFLHIQSNRLQLTAKGLLFYDTVATELISSD